MESGLANATEDKKQDDIVNWISPVAANEINLKFLFNASIITMYGHNNTYEDLDELLYDVPTSLIVLLSCFYGTISVLAVIGNFLVMWIVATSRRMQNVINCYIANLALADIVIGLFAIPFQFQAALLQRWNLPWFMCAFCPFIQALSVNVSVFTLTAIAVDRHSAILNPLNARSSKRVAKIIISCIWLVSVILAAPMAVAWRVEMVTEYTETEVEYTKPFCVTANMSIESMTIYRTCLFVLQYLSPLCIISYAYARMAFKLWATKVPGNAQGTRDATIMKNKKKVIKMLVIVVSLFGICWLPLQTYQVLQTFYPDINGYRYINIVFFCFDWLAMSNSCYNPFIYGIYNEKFKREFRERFPFLPSAWKSSNQSDVYNTEKSHFPTRFSSLRSSGEGRYSTRMSIGPAAANNASFISRKRSRQSMYYYKTNDRSDDESLSVSYEKNSKLEPDACSEPILRCPYSETRNVPRILKSTNGHARTLPLGTYADDCQVMKEDNSDKKRCTFRKSDCYCDSSKYDAEKHTELYILQNSDIIDFKDDKLTENNVSKKFIEHKL